MKKARAFSLKLVCRFAAPVFSAAFYVFIVLVAIMLVALPIIALANVTAGEMLLPPFMRGGESNGTTGYFISLGNGLSMFAAGDSVTAVKIKSSIYLAFMLWSVTLAALIPLCRFISKLCANVRDDRIFEPKNAAYVNYTGITVIAGGLAISFLTRFYNYGLVTLFTSGAGDVKFAPGISAGGIFIGLFILLLGSIWGYACRLHMQPPEDPNLPQPRR